MNTNSYLKFFIIKFFLIVFFIICNEARLENIGKEHFCTFFIFSVLNFFSISIFIIKNLKMRVLAFG